MLSYYRNPNTSPKTRKSTRHPEYNLLEKQEHYQKLKADLYKRIEECFSNICVKVSLQRSDLPWLASDRRCTRREKPAMQKLEPVTHDTKTEKKISYFIKRMTHAHQLPEGISITQ